LLVYDIPCEIKIRSVLIKDRGLSEPKASSAGRAPGMGRI